MKRVRRRYRVVVLAAIVAALVVPVGFALSLSSGNGRAADGIRPIVPVESFAASSPVLLSTDREEAPFFDDVPDAAKLFLVGTMLVGIAIAVRRSA
jgi:hypothetical protein